MVVFSLIATQKQSSDHSAARAPIDRIPTSNTRDPEKVLINEFTKMSFLLSPMRRIPATTCTRAFSTSRPSQLARITMVGRIGTDPEFSETSGGQQMMRYVVGSSGGPASNKTTSWFRIVHFSDPNSKNAEYMKSLSKGFVASFSLRDAC